MKILVTSHLFDRFLSNINPPGGRDGVWGCFGVRLHFKNIINPHTPLFWDDSSLGMTLFVGYFPNDDFYEILPTSATME